MSDPHLYIGIGYFVIAALFGYYYAKRPTRYPWKPLAVTIWFLVACGIDHVARHRLGTGLFEITAVASSVGLLWYWRGDVTAHWDAQDKLETEAARGVALLRSLPLIAIEYDCETGEVLVATGAGMERDVTGEHVLDAAQSMEEKRLHQAFLAGRREDAEAVVETGGKVYHLAARRNGTTVRVVMQNVTRTVKKVRERASQEAQYTLIQSLTS